MEESGKKWFGRVARQEVGWKSRPARLERYRSGGCYEAICGDLLSLYTSLGSNAKPKAAGGGASSLPPIGNGLVEAQRRLHACLDAADFSAVPQQCSLRGNLWRFRQKGYTQYCGIRRVGVDSLRRASRAYGAPVDALILALCAAALARSKGVDTVELTLYVPLRDAPGEAGLVGLFADWRTIVLDASMDTATVLGMVLDVAFCLRTRRWAVFNALRKPETMMVNFQLMDAANPESRSGFAQIPEEMWRHGENLHAYGRSDELGNVPQPLSITIEEGDKDSWWAHVTCAMNSHPPPFMRRYVKAFEDAFLALCFQPGQKVHTPYPENFY